MKLHKVLFGIILVLAAVCLVLWGLGIDTGLGGISFWQAIGALVCVYWIISVLVKGKSLKSKLHIFLPLAILFLIFERNIAAFAGLESGDIIKNWIVIVAALILEAAVEFLLPGKKSVTFFVRDGEKADKNAAHGSSEKNNFGEKTCYLDATKSKHVLKNSFGEINAYFENADLAADGASIYLDVQNSFGEVSVHVPEDWHVKFSVSGTFNAEDIRPNTQNGRVTLYVTGSNSFGEVQIV